jgi:hypothetical protein
MVAYSKTNVQIFHADIFSSKDSRRSMSGIASEVGIDLLISQIKIIEFDHESVSNKSVIGNHKHFPESNQWEFIFVLGDDSTELIEFRFRNIDQNIERALLRGGDIVSVPPGCSLALVALHEDAQVIEISNKVYDPNNYLLDKLFSENGI